MKLKCFRIDFFFYVFFFKRVLNQLVVRTTPEQCFVISRTGVECKKQCVAGGLEPAAGDGTFLGLSLPHLATTPLSMPIQSARTSIQPAHSPNAHLTKPLPTITNYPTIIVFQVHFCNKVYFKKLELISLFILLSMQ